MTSRQYEGMFLFDSGFAADMSKPESEIKRILDRAGAEVVFCRKWDERRLAYDVGKCRRGTYVLTYFNCPSDGITGIERDAQLSENVLRMLVLRADHVTPEQMNEFAPEKKTEAPPERDGEKPKETEATAEVPVAEVSAAEAPAAEAPVAEAPVAEAPVAEVSAAAPPSEPLKEEPLAKDTASVATSADADDAGESTEP